MNNYRPFSGITPAVKFILIANVVMYFLSAFLERSTGVNMSRVLGLHLVQSEYWRPYQYITHMFMHGSISHLFFNMFAVFMFGRILENVWGSKRFLIFYLITGIGAALLNSAIGGWDYHQMQQQFADFQQNPSPTLLAEFLRDSNLGGNPNVWTFIDQWIKEPNSPGFIQQGIVYFRSAIYALVNIPMIGASGAVFGILVAFGMLFPNTELYLLFVPIPIKAKYFVIGYGLIELFLGLQNNPGDNVAHFAHLGGLLVGFILVKIWNRNKKSFY
ncbi:MAG: rhomboid family intramembrane serine protease [Odoribacter sp.]|nr:rhomboid family intramembrane serine protease [Odoribacter sp.]